MSGTLRINALLDLGLSLGDVDRIRDRTNELVAQTWASAEFSGTPPEVTSGQVVEVLRAFLEVKQEQA